MLEAARDLYSMPPAAFIAARNQLSKELKAAGNMAEAATVAKLRRPRLAEWALNRLAHADPELITRFAHAIAIAQQAQSAAIGGDGGGLRAATSELRDSLNAVATAAVRGLAADGGSGEAQRDDLTEILRELVANADPSPLVAGVVGSEAIVANGEFFPGAPVPVVHPPGSQAAHHAGKRPAASSATHDGHAHVVSRSKATQVAAATVVRPDTPPAASERRLKLVPKATAAAIRAMARAERLGLQQRAQAAAKALDAARAGVEQAQEALVARRQELKAAQAALDSAAADLAEFEGRSP